MRAKGKLVKGEFEGPQINFIFTPLKDEKS